MSLHSISIQSVTELYNFVESCALPSSLILDHDALHRPWARAVSAEVQEVQWFYPEKPLSAECCQHLENFAHQPLPDKAFLIIRNGQVVRCIDVAQSGGSAQPHLLSGVVRRVLQPNSQRRQPPETSVSAKDANDPYEVLGCSSQDSMQIIKKKYKQRLMEYHPDRVAHLGSELSELALQKTRDINAAFSLIRKERKF